MTNDELGIRNYELEIGNCQQKTIK